MDIFVLSSIFVSIRHFSGASGGCIANQLCLELCVTSVYHITANGSLVIQDILVFATSGRCTHLMKSNRVKPTEVVRRPIVSKSSAANALAPMPMKYLERIRNRLDG